MAKVGLFDEMKNLLEHTKDITNEWDRLTAIECRVSSRLDAIQVEIVGLEKAIGFTSIPYEARTTAALCSASSVTPRWSAWRTCRFGTNGRWPIWKLQDCDD